MSIKQTLLALASDYLKEMPVRELRDDEEPEVWSYSDVDIEVAAALGVDVTDRKHGPHGFAVDLLPAAAQYEASNGHDGARARVWIGEREWVATSATLPTENVIRAAALMALADLMLAGELV